MFATRRGARLSGDRYRRTTARRGVSNVRRSKSQIFYRHIESGIDIFITGKYEMAIETRWQERPTYG